jgi:hypothetical protein
LRAWSWVTTFPGDRDKDNGGKNCTVDKKLTTNSKNFGEPHGDR